MMTKNTLQICRTKCRYKQERYSYKQKLKQIKEIIDKYDNDKFTHTQDFADAFEAIFDILKDGR